MSPRYNISQHQSFHCTFYHHSPAHESGGVASSLGDLTNGTRPRETAGLHIQVELLQLRVRGGLVGGASWGAGVEGGDGESLGGGYRGVRWSVEGQDHHHLVHYLEGAEGERE